MNRFFKALVITTFVLFGLTVVVGFFVFHQLPSLKSISNVLGSKKKVLVTSEQKGTNSMADPNKAVINVPGNSEITLSKSDPAKPLASSVISERFLEDMISAEKPLSDFCKSLAFSRSGAFSAAEFNKVFSESFESEQPDPRIQAAKPLLRYVFRLPKMQQLMTSLEEAAAKNDESLIDKAQFYSSAVAAYGEMLDHQVDMESILDRSYLFMGLNNLIAKKPELANDPRIQIFCQNTELLFNQAAVVDFEQEKNNFLNLLKESSLTPKEISFNPEYKSNIVFNFDGKSLTFSGGWLDELIKTEVPPAPSQN